MIPNLTFKGWFLLPLIMNLNNIMKIEKFNEVKELMNEIDSIKSDMDKISYLLKSCSLSCIISSGRG